MIPLLAVGLLLGALPGEQDAEEEPEPVGFLVLADIGALPRVGIEVEAPLTSSGSAFVAMSYLLQTGLGARRIPGPQVAAGWRHSLFGRGPWGFFLDGRLQVQIDFPTSPLDPSPIVIPGAALTLGFNVKLWHAVASPGISLVYTADPALGVPVLPNLRLAVGAWY